MNFKEKSFHIVGICGIGMSAIALYLKGIGCDVQGSDSVINSTIAQKLRNYGINVIANSPDNITQDIDFLVKSTAIKNNDPELVKANALGITTLSRSDILSEITRRNSCVVSISGAHGKTTTTTMTGELLYYLNANPTIFSGGIMGLFDSNFRAGSDQLMIVEADESDGTFMNLKTDVAVLTNVEFEHAEYYRDLEHLIDCCEKFVNGDSVQSVVVCGDDPIIKQLKITKNHVIRYGFDQSNDVYAKDLGENFTIIAFGREIRNVKLNSYGKHNILNALAALSIAIATYGLTDQVIDGGLKMMENFKGVARRFNILANNKGVKIIDDYAHHPTEIHATIASAHELKSRIIAVLQPHRYSRLSALMQDFVSCMSDADVAIVSDVYSAGEEPIDGVSGEVLVQLMQEKFPHKEIYFRSDRDSIYQLLDNIKLPGDVIVFMGAGNITDWAKNYAVG
jgi:UDP-N-acetylmuramate--alanine ligase